MSAEETMTIFLVGAVVAVVLCLPFVAVYIWTNHKHVNRAMAVSDLIGVCTVVSTTAVTDLTNVE